MNKKSSKSPVGGPKTKAQATSRAHATPKAAKAKRATPMVLHSEVLPTVEPAVSVPLGDVSIPQVLVEGSVEAMADAHPAAVLPDMEVARAVTEVVAPKAEREVETTAPKAQRRIEAPVADEPEAETEGLLETVGQAWLSTLKGIHGLQEQSEAMLLATIEQNRHMREEGLRTAAQVAERLVHDQKVLQYVWDTTTRTMLYSMRLPVFEPRRASAPTPQSAPSR